MKQALVCADGVAYESTGRLQEPARSTRAGRAAMPSTARPTPDVEVKVRKPGGGHSTHH